MEENPIPITPYPPGIRFHPLDEELITFYLQRKVKSLPLPANMIADIELYSYNPWDLPRKALFGEDEWYFFTPRDKKYPNGWRPNRTARSGYWKATGIDKQIISSSGSRRSIGVKKDLVFYKGKPPSGVKMDWIMTEYRLPDTSRPLRSKGSMRLDDWVLCRLRQKGNMSKNAREDDESSCEFLEFFPKIGEHRSREEKSRDILADYLLSSEYHLIASLLIGNDPGVVSMPRTTFQSNNSGTIYENRALSSLYSLPGQINEKKDGATKGINEYNNNISGGYKFETNYSSNAYINFQELDMPALSEDFLQ